MGYGPEGDPVHQQIVATLKEIMSAAGYVPMKSKGRVENPYNYGDGNAHEPDGFAYSPDQGRYARCEAKHGDDDLDKAAETQIYLFVSRENKKTKKESILFLGIEIQNLFNLSNVFSHWDLSDEQLERIYVLGWDPEETVFLGNGVEVRDFEKRPMEAFIDYLNQLTDEPIA